MEANAMDRAIPKKKWTVKKILLWVVLPTTLIALVAMVINRAGESRLNVEKEKITVTNVTECVFQEFISVSGTIAPIKTVFIDASDGGKVEELYKEGGEMVEKGSPILRLANANLQLSYMNQETAIMEQINNLSSTRITIEEQSIRFLEELNEVEYQILNLGRQHKINQQLYKQKMIATQEYNQIKDEYEFQKRRKKIIQQKLQTNGRLRNVQLAQIDPSIQLMQRNLEMIHKNQENLTIKAPIAGQLSTVQAELGQTIQAGENIAQIDILDSYKVRVRIDEYHISRIEIGQQGTFDFSGKTYTIIIKKVYPEVTNGTFAVDMEFENKKSPEGIKRGQSVQVRLALSAKTKAVLLPRGSFYQETGGNWIYVVDEEAGIAYRRKIKLGRQNPQYYEVIDGLQPGEKVVTSNYETYDRIDKLILK